MKRSPLLTSISIIVIIIAMSFPPSASAMCTVFTDTTTKKPVNKTAPKSVTVPCCHISQITRFRIDTITSRDLKVKLTTLKEDKEVIVTISNPKDFLLSRPSDKSQLILYADGFPLTGMSSTYFTEVSREYLNDTTKCWPSSIDIPFIFKRDTSTEAAWASMFHLAKWNKNRITFDMSLGWSGMFPLQTSAVKPVNTKVTVVFYSESFFVIYSILYIIFILFFIWLCHSTGLIRDPDTINRINGPYSLAQTQLAFWTVIVIGGFGYIWLLTGQADALNSSVLLLLGISSTTTGAASFIDYYKRTNLEKNLASQQQTQAAAAAPVAPLDPAAPVDPVVPVVPAVPVAPAIVPNTIKQHRNFILDILSDGVNMSVQRTQTVMWNLALGLYFIWYVVTDKAMPEFSGTLLVLAGVSSVLYVGSKGPENPQTKQLPA
jgi:hypothetical protein